MTPVPLEIIEGMPAANYHAHAYTSRSEIVVMADKSPLHANLYKKREPEPFTKGSAGRRLGTLVHLAVLEPHLFATQVVVVDGHRASKDVKAKVEEAEALGKYVVKTDEFEQVLAMSASVLTHPKAREFIVRSKKESSLFWGYRNDAVDPDGFEIGCKARTDLICPDSGVIGDIKTFTELGDFALIKQIARMKYHWQAAWYLWGAEKCYERVFHKFVCIFVETEYPYACRPIEIAPAAIEKGGQDMFYHLAKYHQYKKHDFWPGYSEEIDTITLPDYAW